MAFAILKHTPYRVKNLFLMPDRKTTTEKDFVKDYDEPNLGGLHFIPSHLAAPDCQGARGALPSLTVKEDMTLLVAVGCLRHHQQSQEG